MTADLVDLARAAAKRRDWVEALQRWDAAQDRMPGRLDARIGAIAALRGLGRLDDAAARLTDAFACFGERPTLTIEAARLADARGNRSEALRLWDDVQRQSPDRPAAPVARARLLRLSGRMDEARAVTAEAIRRFADHAPLWLEHARCHDGTDGGGEALWQQVRDRFPDLPAAAIRLCAILREQNRMDAAAEVLHRARDRFPSDVDVMIEAARLAAARGRLDDAIGMWEAARAARPDQFSAYPEAARVLRRAGRLDAAEALLAEGVRRLPDSPGIALLHADVLLAMHRLIDAHAGYAAVRQRFPGHAGGYVGGARALVVAGERAAADALLTDAILRLPDDPALALEHALLPLTRTFQAPAQRQEARRRLIRVVERFPTYPAGHVHLLRVLAIMHRREEEARARAEAAARLLPDSAQVAIAVAEQALRSGGQDNAVETARALVGRFPGEPKAIALLADALSLTGDHAAAESVLARARDDMPLSLDLEVARATVASRRGDWTEAADRWANAHARFPAAPFLASRLHDARLAAIGAGQAETAMPVAAAAPEEQPGTLAALMGRFESLGGRPYGCEFGFVQRSFDAHPLGLLRWTRSDPAMLAAALEARFEGIGTPEQTRLRVLKAGEYLARDLRYGFDTHTFVRRREMDEAEMYRQLCVRQQFLADRLRKQLAEGGRIFVYKNTRISVSEEDLERLHNAFRALCQGTLLVVRRAASEEANGKVRWVAPGLMVGTLVPLGQRRDGWRSAPSLAAWRRLCSEADRLVRGGGRD